MPNIIGVPHPRKSGADEKQTVNYSTVEVLVNQICPYAEIAEPVAFEVGL